MSKVKIHKYLNQIVFYEMLLNQISNNDIPEDNITANVKRTIDLLGMADSIPFLNLFYRFRNRPFERFEIFDPSSKEEVTSGSDFLIEFKKNNRSIRYLYQAKKIIHHAKSVRLGDEKRTNKLSDFLRDKSKSLGPLKGMKRRKGKIVSLKPKMLQMDIQLEFAKSIRAGAYHIFYFNQKKLIPSFCALFTSTKVLKNSLNGKKSFSLTRGSSVQKIIKSYEGNSLERYLNEYGFFEFDQNIELEEIKRYYEEFDSGLIEEGNFQDCKNDSEILSVESILVREDKKSKTRYVNSEDGSVVYLNSDSEIDYRPKFILSVNL